MASCWFYYENALDCIGMTLTQESRARSNLTSKKIYIACFFIFYRENALCYSGRESSTGSNISHSVTYYRDAKTSRSKKI